MKLASNAARVRCKDGCGDYGLQELEYLCVDCDTRRQLHSADTAMEPSQPFQRKALRSGKDEWISFIATEREKDTKAVDDEVATFKQIKSDEFEAEKKKKHYMLATNNGEEVDKVLWTATQQKY